MSIDVAQAWIALKSALLLQHPQLQKRLAPPAREKELAALQDRFGQSLSDEFVQIYQMNDWYDSICDPEQSDKDEEPLEGPFHRMSIEDIVVALDQTGKLHEQPDMMAELFENLTSLPADAIKQTYYNRQLLPFCADGGGNGIGTDLDPGSTGTRGQIIGHGRDEREMWVLANNLAGFLDLMLGTFEAGCLAPGGSPTDNRKAYLQGRRPEAGNVYFDHRKQRLRHHQGVECLAAAEKHVSIHVYAFSAITNCKHSLVSYSILDR